MGDLVLVNQGVVEVGEEDVPEAEGDICLVEVSVLGDVLVEVVPLVDDAVMQRRWGVLVDLVDELRLEDDDDIAEVRRRVDCLPNIVGSRLYGVVGDPGPRLADLVRLRDLDSAAVVDVNAKDGDFVLDRVEVWVLLVVIPQVLLVGLELAVLLEPFQLDRLDLTEVDVQRVVVCECTLLALGHLRVARSQPW